MSDRELLQQALDALIYHTLQTRPIHDTDEAIANLRAKLAAGAVPASEAMPVSKYGSVEMQDLILANLAQPEQEHKCWCETCRLITFGKDMRMVLCPVCGNKRCPHATDHRNACTNSNDVGQAGSAWEHVRPYTAPLAPQARELSDDGLKLIAITDGVYDCITDPYDRLENGDEHSSVMGDLIRFARAVLAARGEK